MIIDQNLVFICRDRTGNLDARYKLIRTPCFSGRGKSRNKNLRILNSADLHEIVRSRVYLQNDLRFTDKNDRKQLLSAVIFVVSICVERRFRERSSAQNRRENNLH